MQSGSFCGLGLMMALGSSLHADWKITTVATAATGQQIETEYFKDGLKRRDFRDGVNGPLRSVSVIDFKNLRDTAWDMKTRRYMVRRLHTALKFEGVAGPVIVIDIETIDTGERRTMFGHTARHLITKERRHPATGERAKTDQWESQTDGWYIDADSLPAEKRGGFIDVLAIGGQRPLLKVNRTGPAATGLPLWLRKTSVNTMPNGQRDESELTVEVTELFEGPLERALFEPPGFQRVVSLPGNYPLAWGEQMRLRWEWLQDWVSGLFT
jgi:hypothetical protein